MVIAHPSSIPQDGGDPACKILNVDSGKIRTQYEFTKFGSKFSSTESGDGNTYVTFVPGKGAKITKSANVVDFVNIRLDDGKVYHYVKAQAGSNCMVVGSDKWTEVRQVTYFKSI